MLLLMLCCESRKAGLTLMFNVCTDDVVDNSGWCRLD